MGEFTSIVIFGASGDLTRRKLIPALYNLARKQRLNSAYQIIGVSRSPLSHEEFRAHLLESAREFIPEDLEAATWEKFAQHIYYYAGDGTQEDSLRGLKDFLAEREDEGANRVYYLSTAPSLYAPIAKNLGAHDMARAEKGWRRIVVEKPFGYDLATAHELNEQLQSVFDEEQIYRIDHYLGKETAQNVLFLRFANILFEPIWNRNYIDHMQITVSETVDVGHRADYYDQSGVMRDMFQNHLLQLLALVTMEPPNTFSADEIRDERVKLLRAVRPVALADTVRAQYDGYAQARGVAPGTQTPTYAALKLHIDNWRWQGVPFYLRSGKALKNKTTELSVHFKEPARMVFAQPRNGEVETNILSLCIQPDEGAHLMLQAKRPDTRELATVRMEFHYRDSFHRDSMPEAYERLLLDVLLGDASLFIRSDNIEVAWKIIDPILEGWEDAKQALPLAHYTRGTWGPAEADEMLDIDGRQWWVSCCEH